VIERINSGFADIVLGTRSAIFAPLKKVSLIAVLHEHNWSYKQESTPCYNGRDIAVMRGFLEKATVLLSSVCPSVESLFNCRLRKYSLIKPLDKKKRPKIRLLDMKHEKLTKPYLSKAVVDISARYIHQNKKVIFVINRRGYSTLLQCLDCNYIEECPACKIPLIFHKQDMSMRCHYCGYTESTVPDTCKRCHGFNLEMLGAGTQRIQEDIEELLGIKTIRFDSDKARKKVDIGKLVGEMIRDERKIMIGTKIMTKKAGSLKEFSMAAFLNSDISLNIPNFRSAERTYQDIVSLIDKIDTDGIVFIQTRMPQHYLYKYLKQYDYNAFSREELEIRRSLRYPPYSRLILVKIVSKSDFSKELSEVLNNSQGEVRDVEILGPYISRTKKGEDEFKLLLKSSVRMSLHVAARDLIKAFKNSRDVKIRVDVDPIEI
jgi:primosomal protein N' (replication factor Y)